VPPRRQVNPPRWSEERPAPARQLFDGSDHPDSDFLQRHWSRARSIDSASTSSTPQEAASGAAPRRLQSLLIRGGRVPDVHVSLIAGGSQGSIPAVAEVGGSAPVQLGERSAASSRRWIEVGQPPSRRAPSVQPPSRTHQAAWRISPGCAPRCKFLSLESPS
jgi:hypothetical protein